MALAAAERIVADQGLAGLTMRRLAAEIGYSPGQLYLLFGNQDGLLLAVNARTLAHITAHLNEALDPALALLPRLQAAAQAYIDFALNQPARWRLLFEHQLAPDEPVPDAHRDAVEGVFRLIEAQWPQDEKITADERRARATALWSGVHGVAVLAVSGKLNWSGISDYGDLSGRLVRSMV